MTDIIPLFGGHTTKSGQRLGGGLARQARRQQDEIELRTERAVLHEQAEAFRASVVLTHAATLVAQAESHMRVAPSGREIYEDLLHGWARGASARTARGL